MSAFGDKEESLWEIQETLGQDVPALTNKPKLSDLATEVADAYKLLSHTRTGNGYGPNPLSLAEISAFIQLNGEPLLPKRVFVELILCMDQRHLSLELEKSKQKKGASGRKT